MSWKTATLFALGAGLLLQSSRRWLQRLHIGRRAGAEHGKAVERWEDEGGMPADMAPPPEPTRATRKAAAAAAGAAAKRAS